MLTNKNSQRLLLLPPLLIFIFQSLLMYRELNLVQSPVLVTVDSSASFAPLFPVLLDSCLFFSSKSCAKYKNGAKRNVCVFLRTSLKQSPLDVFASAASLINAGTKFSRIQIVLVDVEENDFVDLKPLAEQLNDIYETPIVSYMHRASKSKSSPSAEETNEKNKKLVTDEILLEFFRQGGHFNSTVAYLANKKAFCGSILITDAGHLYSENFLFETGTLLGQGHIMVRYI